MLEIADFFGINTDLRINHNSIPYTDYTFRTKIYDCNVCKLIPQKFIYLTLNLSSENHNLQLNIVYDMI